MSLPPKLRTVAPPVLRSLSTARSCDTRRPSAGEYRQDSAVDRRDSKSWHARAPLLARLDRRFWIVFGVGVLCVAAFFGGMAVTGWRR